MKSSPVQLAYEANMKSCAISIRGETKSSPVQLAYEANMKSCAISIRGETKSSPVQLAYEANIKSGASNIRDKLNQKKKKGCVRMVAVASDKIGVFVFASLLFLRNE